MSTLRYHCDVAHIALALLLVPGPRHQPPSPPGASWARPDLAPRQRPRQTGCQMACMHRCAIEVAPWASILKTGRICAQGNRIAQDRSRAKRRPTGTQQHCCLKGGRKGLHELRLPMRAN
eukprot:1160461-Pelagomonas_calceolata.AAC.2